MYRRPAFTDYLTAYTSGSMNVGRFWFLTGAMDTAPIRAGRPAIELLHVTSANLSAVVGWQESDDALLWPLVSATPGLFSPSTLAAQNADGLVFGAPFENITFTKRYARFGVWILNTAANAREWCQVAIRVETRNF